MPPNVKAGKPSVLYLITRMFRSVFVSFALGSIGAEGKKEWMKNSYCLWRIMVNIDYQGKGFGKELLTSVIEW